MKLKKQTQAFNDLSVIVNIGKNIFEISLF